MMNEYADLIPKGKNEFQDLIPSAAGANEYADLIPKKTPAFTSEEFPWMAEAQGLTQEDVEALVPKRRPEGIYAAPPETTMGRVGAFIGESVVPFSRQIRGEAEWRSPETAMEAGALFAIPKFFQAGAALAPRLINRFKPGYLMKAATREAHRIRPPIAPLPKVEPVTPAEVTPPIPEVAPRPVMPERYLGEVQEIRDIIRHGEAGGVLTEGQGRYGSSMKLQQLLGGMKAGKDETLTAIDKGIAGEKLGVRQQEIFDRVKETARDVFGEKVRIAQKEKIQPINTGELEPGDRIKVHGEVLKVTEKTPDEIVIKDGQEYHLDPYFDKIEGKKIAPAPRAEAPTPKIDVEEINLQAYPKSLGGGARIPKYAEGSSINLERLDTTDELKEFTNGLTKSIEEKIGKKKVTWGEVRQKAESLGWDEKAVSNAWAKKGSFSAAEIDAARQLNLNSISALHEKVKNLPGDVKTYSPELRAQVLDTLNLVRTTSQASSEAGRSLNVHKRVLQNDPSFKEASEINRALNALKGKGVERTDDLINALRTIDFNDPSAVNRFVYSVTKTKWEKLSDAAHELWINGLLSNPGTHIVNSTSNTLTLIGQYPERLAGAGIERIRSGLGIFGGRQQERFAGETLEDAFSLIQGIKAGARRFLNAYRSGKPLESKIESYTSALSPKVQKFLPGRTLMAEDEFFKGVIQNGEISRLAIRKAKMQGLKGQTFNDRVIELETNPTEEMLEQAGAKAKELTYQSDVGKVGQWVMRGRESIPGLKYIIPFVKTPLNIAKFALQRTPLNVGRIAYKTAKGELAGGEFSEEVAKTLTGTMVGALTYIFALEGHVTGGGPKDKSKREALFRTGWQPYSIRIGDEYYSFARLEPLGSILGISADFAELQNKMMENEKQSVGTAIGSSIAKNFSSKTFLMGFSKFSDAISDPGRYGEQFIRDLSGSVIPAVSGGVARSLDPELRDAKTILDRARTRLPGLSEGVPARQDIWGQPIKRTGHPLTRFLSPVQVGEAQGEPIDREIVKLKYSPGMPSKTIEKTELTPEQYAEYVRMSGGAAKEELNKMIQKGWYQRLSDEDKASEIRKVIENYRREARERLSRKYGIGK